MAKRPDISQDLAYLKVAAISPGTKDLAAKIIGSLVTAGMVGGAGGLMAYSSTKHRLNKRNEELEKSKKALLTHSGFSSQPSQFAQRFSELSLISPTVASNPRLAKQLLESKMNSGFDVDDVHRLTAIEHHSAAIPKLDPGQAAMHGAMSSIWGLTNLFAPAFLMKSFATSQKAIKDIVAPPKPTKAEQTASLEESLLEEMEEMGIPSKFNKQSSADFPLNVSEECLGRMLADRYCMLKTAGILQSAGNFAKKIPGAVMRGGKQALTNSSAHVGNYLSYMALPLALGGGIALVDKLLKNREESKQRELANSVFDHLQSTNAYVQENPATAREAFDILSSFAPSLAAKPLVAKTFVEHVLQTGDGGRIAPDMINLLATTQNIIAKRDEGASGFIEGLKNPMSLFKHTISKPSDKKGNGGSG